MDDSGSCFKHRGFKHILVTDGKHCESPPLAGLAGLAAPLAPDHAVGRLNGVVEMTVFASFFSPPVRLYTRVEIRHLALYLGAGAILMHLQHF